MEGCLHFRQRQKGKIGSGFHGSATVLDETTLHQGSVPTVKRFVPRERVAIGRKSLATNPQTVSRWDRDELQVGSWHRQVLLARVSAKPRDNLEQRLSEVHSNPVLTLAHLLSDCHGRTAVVRPTGCRPKHGHRAEVYRKCGREDQSWLLGERAERELTHFV